MPVPLPSVLPSVDLLLTYLTTPRLDTCPKIHQSSGFFNRLKLLYGNMIIHFVSDEIKEEVCDIKSENAVKQDETKL